MSNNSGILLKELWSIIIQYVGDFDTMLTLNLVSKEMRKLFIQFKAYNEYYCYKYCSCLELLKYKIRVKEYIIKHPKEIEYICKNDELNYKSSCHHITFNKLDHDEIFDFFEKYSTLTLYLSNPVPVINEFYKDLKYVEECCIDKIGLELSYYIEYIEYIIELYGDNILNIKSSKSSIYNTLMYFIIIKLWYCRFHTVKQHATRDFSGDHEQFEKILKYILKNMDKEKCKNTLRIITSMFNEYGKSIKHSNIAVQKLIETHSLHMFHYIDKSTKQICIDKLKELESIN